MRTEKNSSRMAWGERAGMFRSAKWSAAMVVATFAALLVFCNSLLLGAQQTDLQRAAQARVAQRRAAEAHTLEILSQDWKRWMASDCESVLRYSRWAAASVMQGTTSGGISIELRSALPIREALLRQLQLRQHYDTMSPAQKFAFDEKNPPEMVDREGDPILLYVERNATYDDDGENAPDPPQEAALEFRDGSLVMPTKTEALQDDQDRNKVVYSFPRVMNGIPVLTARDRELNFVFGKPLVKAGRIRPFQDPQQFKMHALKYASIPGTKQKVLIADGHLTRISFSIPELMYNGKLEY